MMRDCKNAPIGWRCTRPEGHLGPCAAVPNRVGWVVYFATALFCGVLIFGLIARWVGLL